MYEGTFRGQPVAIKRMIRSCKNPVAVYEAFEAESNLPPLQHPHVVQIFAATQTISPEKLLVMELIPQARTLPTLIYYEETYDWRTFGRQLLSALAFLHQQHLTHLDLKPANLLVNPQQICKLADFGGSKNVHDLPPSPSQLQGTLHYRAPELLRGDLPTTKADIYSLGITLWSLITQQQPYQGQNNFIIAYMVVSKHLRPTPVTEPLLTRLWHAERKRRPDADNITL